MANTTNYNWETPDDTDLVKDGAAAIRTLGSSVDTTTKALNPSTTLGDIEYRSATANTNTRLGIGSTGQVLTVAGGVPTWATSDDANAIQNAIVDAKGDIVAASANDTPARLAVGTDNHRLVAASGETTGLKYVADTVNTVIDAEGDLLVGDAADAVQRLAIGTTGQVLTVDTAVDGKIKWAAASGGASALTKISTTTFTSISSSSITGCFSATYDNYLIICSDWINSTGDANVALFLRTGGTNATTNYIVNGFYNNNSNITGTSFTSQINSFFTNASVKSASVINIQSPFLSKRTTFQCENTGRQYGSSYRGLHDVETSYADLGVTVDANTGSGVITIYGYSI
jgi:hypothetical protein